MQENSMIINLQVNNQTLHRISSETIVENSENYLFAQFEFSDDWNNTTKYAIIEGNDLRYKVELDENDKCKIPTAIIKHNGFSLMLVGENEQKYVVITTTTIRIPIYKTNYEQPEIPDVKYITSSDDTLNITKDGDLVDVKLPNIYFADANLTNNILNFLGRDNELLKSIHLPYGKIHDIQLELNQSTFALTLSAYDEESTLLFEREVDFDLEPIVFDNVYYDSVSQELVFVTHSGSEIRVPIGDILTGIATETWVNTQLLNYVQKESGKGLSTNDYTTIEKNKLSGIENEAQKNVQPDWNEQDSNEDDFIKNKPTIPSKTSDLINDSGFIDNTYHDSTKQNVIDNNNKLNADYVDDTNATNKFVSATEKAQITTNRNDIEGIKNGASINSFGGVETALNGKQDTLSGSTSIDITSNVVSVKDSYVEGFFATSQEIDDMLEEVFG